MTATFVHSQRGSGDIVIQLQPAGFGHYRGSAVLNDPNVWSLQVDATRENVPGSRAENSGAVTVQAAFTGTDGRRYLVQPATEPASPVVGQETIVRAALVDAERGTRCPPGWS